ncbi:MAG TPA: hypothetical protein PLE72_00725 [Azospira sp.]|nr:hypothetical protein [Azospira sp.]
MSRRLRISLAVWLIWAALMLLILIGETSNALPTQLLTTILGRFVPDGANEALPPPLRVVNWSRFIFCILGPAFLLAVIIHVGSWVGERTLSNAPAHESGPSSCSPMIGRYLIGLLRILRAMLYLVAAWQVVTLLPALSWLSSPDQISGAMLTQLFLKGAVFAISGIGSKLLRILINRLHVRYFGADHPALTRRFAL